MVVVVDGAAVEVAAGRTSSTSVATESVSVVLVAPVVVVATVVGEVVVLTVVVVVLVRSEMSGGMVGRKLKGCCCPLAGLRAVLIREGPLRPGTFGLY